MIFQTDSSILINTSKLFSKGERTLPEYPDITVYIERLTDLIVGQTLGKIRVISPFLLRTAQPPLSELEGRTVQRITRMGKRIVFGFEEDYFLILHLMVAGRLRWSEPDAKIPGKIGLAALDFPNGTLIITEAGSKKRASLHLVLGQQNLAVHDPGGIEVLECTESQFMKRIQEENHTLKRSLTDPQIFSGIGNAYSDEILHHARLSPILLTQKMDKNQIHGLYEATQKILKEWTDRLRSETGDGFPAKVTAFRKDMSAHGRYGQPCPVCQAPIQRIRYASNETNYCPACQTDGKLLADRSLSRLLKKDWPRTLEDLEEKKQSLKGDTK